MAKILKLKRVDETIDWFIVEITYKYWFFGWKTKTVMAKSEIWHSFNRTSRPTALDGGECFCINDFRDTVSYFYQSKKDELILEKK